MKIAAVVYGHFAVFIIIISLYKDGNSDVWPNLKAS